MPRVFVPGIPSRFDAASKLWIPTMDLTSAERFGQLVIMLPPNAARAGIVPCVDALHEKMKDYGPDDMIIGLGDPSLIGASSCIAARKAGGLLRMLKWDRMAGDYFLVEVRV